MEETVAPEESGQVTEEVNPLAFDPGSLPEGLRAEPSLQTFDSVDKLAKSYVNAVKKIGSDPSSMVQLPREGESWDNFYNQVGRPETPEGYEFGDDPENTLEFYRNATHQLGLTQEQAQGKREGQASYDAKMDQAQRAFKQFSTPELDKLIDETGLGNHPEFIKTFAKIGSMIGEDRLVVGTGLGQSGISPHDAKAEIQSLYSDAEFSKSYRDNTDPGHKAAMDKMDKLFKTAYPGP